MATTTKNTTDLTPAEYQARLREMAQSILAGIQRLEDLNATADDDAYSNLAHALNEADGDVWATIDHIAEGRPGDV